MVAMLKPETDALPIFTGQSWQDHVTAWKVVARDAEERQWMLGAIAASLNGKYGDKKMGKFATEVSTPASTIWQYAQVYKTFEKSERSDNLSWSHHLIAMSASDPTEALQVAEQQCLSVRQLQQWIDRNTRPSEPLILLPESNSRVVTSLQELISEDEVFSTLYADPPWQYGNQGTRAATDNHYETMTVEEIAALPVAAVSSPNAHLHLWTTNAFLFDAKRIMEAWGFEYKSVFVWCKNQMGIGNYWRVSHEFLLFGIRGSQPFRDRSEMSWAAIDREGHSTKPDEIRRKVMKVSPGPYLELFGREAWPGWTVFGNQVFNLADPRRLQPVEGPLFGGQPL